MYILYTVKAKSLKLNVTKGMGWMLYLKFERLHTRRTRKKRRWRDRNLFVFVFFIFFLFCYTRLRACLRVFIATCHAYCLLRVCLLPLLPRPLLLHFFVICLVFSQFEFSVDGSLSVSVLIISLCELHWLHVPFTYRHAFLHFFSIFLVFSHVSSPFFSVNVRAFTLVFSSHGDHCDFS